MGDGNVHRVFLIRHGETVDNVAGLYAGVRDSPLTTHGITQAQRLGAHLTNNAVTPSHLFSSNLSRAVKTAEALRAAQPSLTAAALELVQCEDLREQNFGSFEGKSFMAHTAESKAAAREAQNTDNKQEPEFQATETKEAMAVRSNRFLDQHLMPLLEGQGLDHCLVVVVVSHGILLSSLWKSLLRRQKQHSVTFAHGATRPYGFTSLEHLGGWSNTGYLELSFRPVAWLPSGIPPSSFAVNQSTNTPAPHDTECPAVPTIASFAITIHAVNSKDHLRNLKRTRGGVGSSKHDDKQQSLHTFFTKKPKLEQSP